MNSTTETGLVRKDSIEELCGHRARALDLYARAFDLIEQARNAHARAGTGVETAMIVVDAA